MAEGLLAGSPHTVSTASQPAIAPHVTYSTLNYIITTNTRLTTSGGYVPC